MLQDLGLLSAICEYPWPLPRGLVCTALSATQVPVSAFPSGALISYAPENRYPQPFLNYSSFLPAACDFDAVIFATFPDFHEDFADQLVAMACPGQAYGFVVHNTDKLEMWGAELARDGALRCIAQHASAPASVPGTALCSM